MRKVPWVIAVALLLVTGISGLIEVSSEFGGSHGLLQRSVSVAVLLYGVLGVVGAVGLAMRRRWSVLACALWGACVVYSASVASFAFNDPTFSNSDTVAGVAMAAVATVLIALFVVWAAHSATRTQNLPPATGGDHIPSP